MNSPIVYIEKEPFLGMLLGAIDPFKRECLGYIFGKKPSRGDNSYIVESAVLVQSAQMRKNSEIEQSQLSLRRMNAIFRDYKSLYPLIGDFHSHPEWGKHDGSPELTNKDIADMKEAEPGYLGIVIGVSTRERQPLLSWQTVGGYVKGSLSKYIFEVSVYVVTQKDGSLSPQRLKIAAPAAIKALNRALGYS